MEPIPFKDQNGTLGRGDNHESVSELPIYRGKLLIDEHGTTADCIISCWSLTTPEIEEITRTGRMYVGVMGVSQPPIFAAAYSPFPRAIPDADQTKD